MARQSVLPENPDMETVKRCAAQTPVVNAWDLE